MLESSSYMEYAMKHQNIDVEQVHAIADPSFTEVFNVSSSESTASLKNGKIRDSRISDLENKLAMAENRCSVLRRKVSYMRMLYTSSIQPDTPSDEDDKSGLERDPNFYKSGQDYHYLNPPANMAARSTNPLNVDPKDTVEHIVSKMVQSVNTKATHSTQCDQSKRKLKKEVVLPKKYVRSYKRPEINWKTDRTPSKKKINIEKQAVVKPKALPPIRKPALSPKTRQPAKLKTPNVGLKDTAGSVASQKPRRVLSQSMTFLLPTLSYRMKCVPPVCRYSFSRKIPFVLGKSTNKSHNIGTKVQETMSLLRRARTVLNPGSRETTNDDQSKANAQQRPMSTSGPTKLRGLMTVGLSNGYKNYQLRTVLMNLHDEFSKMTDNCEELKASLKENPDPNTAQMARRLEEQLDAKEIEINAFIDLYKQVSLFKSGSSSAFLSASGEPTTSSEMARLLRRIENFQNELKSSTY